MLTYSLLVAGCALIVAGIARPVPIFLLWGPGLVLVLVGMFGLEVRRHKRRMRARRRGGWIV